MSSQEIARQLDMFTSQWVDNRTQHQKRLDRDREQPQQMEMFAQREIAQFGVNAHPLLPLSPNTRLLLIPEDPRSEEEREQDTQLEAERQTYQMFANPPENAQEQPLGQITITADTEPLALVPRGIVALVVLEEVCRALIVVETSSPEGRLYE